MNPEQPAARSKAAAPRAPRLFCTMQAVAGIGMSGVTVAQTIRSTPEAGRPADSRARSAARVANCDMYSSSRATRRSRMPARLSPRIVVSLRRPPGPGRKGGPGLAGRRDREDLLVNPVVHAIAHEVQGHPHGVLDCANPGPPLTHYSRSPHPPHP